MYFSGKEHHLKKVPDPRKIQALFDDLKKFQEVRQQQLSALLLAARRIQSCWCVVVQILSEQLDEFSGDFVLAGNERIKYMKNEAQSWVAAAAPMFARHQAMTETPLPEQQDMLDIKKVNLF